MLSFFLQSIKMGYIKAFDCYGKDSKWQYLCIMTFQLAWFLFYLWIPYRSDYVILLFFTVFPARHFKQYAVHKLLWPFTRLVFFMAYCPVHHAVRSSVFNPTPGYRRELKE